VKLLLDQGLPRSAADRLRQVGVDAVHVGEVGRHNAEDATILQTARDEGRVVVTLDADFHALLAAAGVITPSVVRIRIEGLKGEELAELLQSLITQCRADLELGAAISVQENRVRIRRLPLGRPQAS
jgi:predicted nuclease of predicted toxin-antitoxin system